MSSVKQCIDWLDNQLYHLGMLITEKETMKQQFAVLDMLGSNHCGQCTNNYLAFAVAGIALVTCVCMHMCDILGNLIKP